MQISIEEIMSFSPCNAWPCERILEVTGGREEFDTSELSEICAVFLRSI